MKQYLDTLRYILENGTKREDRTGTGTISVFGTQNRYDLRKGFPAVTTKKLWFKGVVHELLWMLKGQTNIEYLVNNGVHIWDEWADHKGELGPIYGAQWRSWPAYEAEEITVIDMWGNEDIDINFKDNYLDQIAQVINSIKTNPDSRRHIVSAWNVAEIEKMSLPPCHMMFQFYVANGELSCQMYQRSADFFLGAPFNIASYALLTHMVAQVCGLKVGDFIHTIGDAHIYLNHLDQANEQLSREPYELPTLWLNTSIDNIDDFNYEDIKLVGYNSHPTIKAPISV